MILKMEGLGGNLLDWGAEGEGGENGICGLYGLTLILKMSIW